MTAPRFELTSQRQKVSRLPTEPPGRPAYAEKLNLCYFQVFLQTASKYVMQKNKGSYCRYASHSHVAAIRSARSISIRHHTLCLELGRSQKIYISRVDRWLPRRCGFSRGCLPYSKWASFHLGCGHYHYHQGSSHLSPVHALRFFIAVQVQHSYNSSTNNG